MTCTCGAEGTPFAHGPGCMVGVTPTQEALVQVAQEAEKLGDFYDKVKHLTDHAFRLKLSGKKNTIDFVNAEDLEQLLQEYNPNPTEDEDDEPRSKAPEAPLPEIDLQP